MPPVLRHVVLSVTSLERSHRFYRGLLEPLGWTHESSFQSEGGVPARTLFGPGGVERPALGLREATSPTHAVPYDRFAVGLHHLAFDAPSREAVDERAEWLRRSGAEIEEGPAEYDYMPGYYAVFFFDPDGIKLEVVHKPVFTA